MMIKFLSKISNDHVKANQFQAILRFGSSFLITIILVRSMLTDVEVSIIEYMLLFSLTATFFISFAYSNGALSYIGKADYEKQKILTEQVFFQNIVIGLFVSILMYFLSPSILTYFNKELPDEAVGLMSILIFFLISGGWAEIHLLLQKDAKGLMVFGMSIYLSQIILVLLAIQIDGSPMSVLKAYILWHMIKFIYSLFLIKPTNWSFDISTQKEFYYLVIPLALHFILGSGMDYMDGHIISYFFSEEQFLYYRYGARENPFSLLFINAMSAALIPVLAANFQANLGQLKARLSKLITWVLPISVVLILISPFAFTMVYNDNFILSSQVFNVYILIVSSRLLLPHVLIYAKGDNTALVWFSGLELLINFFLSLWFLHIWGITGVAYATVIAYMINSLATALFCYKKYNIGIAEYLPVRQYFIWMVILFSVYFASILFL